MPNSVESPSDRDINVGVAADIREEVELLEDLWDEHGGRWGNRFETALAELIEQEAQISLSVKAQRTIPTSFG